MKLKKGDRVKVMLGKDNTKEGNIERIDWKKGKVWIAGVNVYKRHVKKQANIEGGIIDIIKPLDISNVVLICPNCDRSTRVGFQIDKDGKKSRVCKKCKKVIDKKEAK